MPLPDVLAAGAVVTRKGGQVLLVHRPKYDDWAFPKGKLDPGEHVVAAAVREVAEETGLDIRLGPPLAGQRYGAGNGRMKAVSYWVGRVVGRDDVSGYRPNAEIDRVEWFDWDKAREVLSYRRDRETLDEALPLRRKTRALVVLRHGKARARKSWSGDDRRRPLTHDGASQAQRVVPLLAAYDAMSVHTSSSSRCVDTVLPYTHATGWPLTTYDALSEEGADAGRIAALVAGLLDSGEGAVVCSHRPVLPAVMAAAGVPEVRLEIGEMLVVHHRKRRVVATETHLA